MQLEKVRHKDGETVIEWTTPNEGDREAHILKSEDEPEAAFIDALEALKSDALAKLSLPEDADDIETDLTTVNVRRDIHGNRAFIFSVRRRVPAGTYSISTPRLRAPGDDTDPDSPVMLNEDQMERIRDLEHQAIRFIQGHRTQGELEFPTSDDEAEPFPDKEAA